MKRLQVAKTLYTLDKQTTDFWTYNFPTNGIGDSDERKIIKHFITSIIILLVRGVAYGS